MENAGPRANRRAASRGLATKGLSEGILFFEMRSQKKT